MANNILIQIQVNKSVMFVFIPHTSLQVYLIKVGLLNKYSKHKEFVGYNLLRSLLQYMYCFVDKIKVINIEYNIKISSLNGMIKQETPFYLSNDVTLPICLYSFDKDNVLFVSLEISQYISLPIFNRAVPEILSYSHNNRKLSIAVDENTLQINKQYRKEILSLELEIFGMIHRCFIEVNQILKILNKYFQNIDEVICNDQLMLTVLSDLLETYVGDFVRLKACKLQMLHKYIKVNTFNLNFDTLKLKCFFYAYDSKIIDRFNQELRKNGTINKDEGHNSFKDFSLNFSVIKNSVYVAASEMTQITKDTILLLGTSATQDNNYLVDLMGKEILCELQTNGSLKIMAIK